jgi:hypothetical protein
MFGYRFGAWFIPAVAVSDRFVTDSSQAFQIFKQKRFCTSPISLPDRLLKRNQADTSIGVF